MRTKSIPCLLALRYSRFNTYSPKYGSVSSIIGTRRFSGAMDVDLPTNENDEFLSRSRHSAAHVMAMAVSKLYPHAKLATGPFTDRGFHYDFHTGDKPMVLQDLKTIKKEMDRIISANHAITSEVVSKEEARHRLKDEPFKLQVLENIKDDQVSFYHIGNLWYDLCAGPHVERTGQLNSKAIKLDSISGAYWRGNESNPMLQRLAATCWRNPEQLEQYLKIQEEAKLRDHRTLGQQLDMFSIQDDAGGGLVFWHPKGAAVRQEIESYWIKQHKKNGYQFINSPHIANLNLWKTSGHFDFYKEDMFQSIKVEEEEYQLKPMNCPFHCLVFKNRPHSYRDFPIRWAELGTVYRHERSGAMHGLFRVRGFTQDDAHIFCLPDQLEDEIVGVLDLIEVVLTKFGFSRYEVKLSTRPAESVGEDEIWAKSTNSLEGALKRKGWNYSVDEGGGAFYGPKIDVKIRDAIGRYWQCSTVQCDFNLPHRFQLEYTDADSTKKRPIMVHRAIFGSLERFFGVLLESTGGNLPLWLAPEQVRIIPVANAHVDYAHQLQVLLEAEGIRVSTDISGDRFPKMIRKSETEKVPISVIVGSTEVESNAATIRVHKIGNLGTVSSLNMVKGLKNAIELNKDITSLEDFQ